MRLWKPVKNSAHSFRCRRLWSLVVDQPGVSTDHAASWPASSARPGGSAFNPVSPLEYAHTKNAPASPLECALTKSLDLKLFGMNSYKNRGGGGRYCPGFSRCL